MSTNVTTNQHWEVIAGGVSYQIDTAKDLWESALLYFQWCDVNPIYKPEIVRSGSESGQVFYTPIPRPYTELAMCMHLGITKDYLLSVATQKEHNDFFFVANRLLEIIHVQNREYGITGVFNPIIISKVLGLGEGSKAMQTPQSINITVEEGPKLLTDERDVDLPEFRK